MSKISVHDLMTICRVLLLVIGQNDTNPKLLQPIVASICKIMTVKKTLHTMTLQKLLNMYVFFPSLPKKYVPAGLESIVLKNNGFIVQL